MPWSPFGAGDGQARHFAFATDSSFFSLAGIANGSIAMHLQDINNNNALYICTGAWNITGAGSLGPPLVLATADFTPSSADLLPSNPLGKAGFYKAYPVVTLSTGPVAMDDQTIEVRYRP